MGKNKPSIYSIKPVFDSNGPIKEITSLSEGKTYTLSFSENRVYIHNHKDKCGEIMTVAYAFEDGKIVVSGKKKGVLFEGEWEGEGSTKRKKSTFIPVNGESVLVSNEKYVLSISKRN